MARPDPTLPLKILPLLAGALLGGSVLFLGIAVFLQRSRPPSDGLEIVAWVAAGWAVATPLLAGALSSHAPRPGIGTSLSDEDAQRLFRLSLVSFAILESGVLTCAVALIVQPAQWPALVALLPLGAMILTLPRAR